MECESEIRKRAILDAQNYLHEQWYKKKRRSDTIFLAVAFCASVGLVIFELLKI